MTLATILAIIQTVLSTTLTLLTGNAALSQKTATLINTLIANAVSIVTNLIANKGSVTAEIVTILQGMEATIQTLKMDTTLPANTLNLISVMDDAVQAALAEDAVASKTVDPTVLTPIEPIP